MEQKIEKSLENVQTSQKEIKTILEELSSQKLKDIKLLDIKEISDICDYMIICTSQSQRQSNAICENLQRILKKTHKRSSLTVEGINTDWTLLDYSDFIVHIFLEEERERIALERLWGDAKISDYS